MDQGTNWVEEVAKGLSEKRLDETEKIIIKRFLKMAMNQSEQKTWELATHLVGVLIDIYTEKSPS